MGKVEQIRTSGPVMTSGDVLTEIIRSGAQEMLAKALEVEISEFLETYREFRVSSGRQRVVRNGFLAARAIQTGV